MPYESRTLPVVIIPPCYRYTNRPGLPVFPGCQLPSGYSRALSIVVTTRLVLGLNQNLRLYARLMLPLTPTKHIYREKDVRSPVCLRASLVPIISHYRGLRVFNGKPGYKAHAIRWLLPGDCLRVFTLKNCSTELEYRLPPRDFHPPKPSHYLIPRLYFCCMVDIQLNSVLCIFVIW